MNTNGKIEKGLHFSSCNLGSVRPLLERAAEQRERVLTS